MRQEIEMLREALSTEAPCGVSLEDTQLLAGFDTYRLFGNDRPLPPNTDWRAIRDKSFEVLAQSRDLRLLAHLAAAVLRTEGIDEFCSTLSVADAWLRNYWSAVYPRVEEDAVLRKNALMCFADRMAIVDAIRRAPVVNHKQLGAYSLRDVELASGQLAPAESDANVPSAAQIEGALEGSKLEELEARSQCITGGVSALRGIIASMQAQGGYESSPDFDPLLGPLLRIERLLNDHLAHRAGAAVSAGDQGDSGADGEAGSTVAVGGIKSRQDAIRAIDAAAAFFRKNEPSSPVPLLLDRAKRLVSRSFLEVLADIAPDSLTQARVVGGIKGEEG